MTGGSAGGRTDAGDRMIQHEFADMGYTCGWFGKWHLSQDGSALDFGFEGFSLPGYGYPYGTAEYQHYLSGFHDGPLWAKVELTGESRREPGASINLTAEDHWFDYEAGTAVLEGTEEVHEAFFLADSATKWIGDLPDDRPFFVRLDAWGPHPPYMILTGFSSLCRGWILHLTEISPMTWVRGQDIIVTTATSGARICSKMPSTGRYCHGVLQSIALSWNERS